MGKERKEEGEAERPWHQIILVGEKKNIGQGGGKSSSRKRHFSFCWFRQREGLLEWNEKKPMFPMFSFRVTKVGKEGNETLLFARCKDMTGCIILTQ